MTDTSESGDDDEATDAPVVDAEAVEHVAELARVRLDADETAAFTAQFTSILESFEALDAVPETDREEPLINVMRPDEVETGLTQDEALENATETEDGFFKGPKVS